MTKQIERRKNNGFSSRLGNQLATALGNDATTDPSEPKSLWLARGLALWSVFAADAGGFIGTGREEG
ncbi:MAG: hypothetical protein LBT63_00230 [Holosporaceae bacterium]|nr:hypothetical protein [Holosporaceae bacterium]